MLGGVAALNWPPRRANKANKQRIAANFIFKVALMIVCMEGSTVDVRFYVAWRSHLSAVKLAQF
jgi:hypothetical protein